MKPRNTYDRQRLSIDCGERINAETGEITNINRCKQSFRDDCDINLIVKRHAQTGMWSHLNPRQPTYGDFTQSTALREAIDLVGRAEKDFASLPARVRALVDNDPAKFLEAMAIPEAVHELAAAGLPMGDGYEPPKPPEPIPTAPATPPPATPAPGTTP